MGRLGPCIIGVSRVSPALLLLSGGLDSTALAAMTRPEGCLFIDYGQTAADAERRAATQVALDLGLRLDMVEIATRSLGAGLMAQRLASTLDVPDVSPEWWPFRNQLLITVGASWAVTRAYSRVVIGTVASDASRHRDGSEDFLAAIDHLVAMQEGGLRVDAPARHLTTAELIAVSGVGDEVLGWTHSCHRANLPCAQCPGCVGRARALRGAGRLQ